MNLRIYYIVVTGFLALASCSKDIKLTNGTPDFDISVAGTTFKAGDPVEFLFSGNAGLISFYSGEVLREYAFKDGRVEPIGTVTLSFTSAVTGGTQTNQLAVVASTNFNGNYNDFPSIQSATWEDITSRFLLGTSATFRASGAGDISDILVKGKPLYLAFKYVTEPQTTAGAARTWMVQALSLTGNTRAGSLLLADMSNANFIINKEVADTSTVPRSSVSTTRVTMLGNNFDAANDPRHEIWAITKAINIDNIDLGPDRPLPIKGIADPMLRSYSYKFTKEGTYKVSFIAANVNIDEAKEVIKQMEIVITP